MSIYLQMTYFCKCKTEQNCDLFIAVVWRCSRWNLYAIYVAWFFKKKRWESKKNVKNVT